MTTAGGQPPEGIGALVQRFRETRQALIEAAETMPPELRDEPFVGTWGIKDVIAHTVGWDHLDREALADYAAGRLPAYYDRYDAGWAALNAELVGRYRQDEWDALMESLRASGEAFTEALQRLSGADLDVGASWHGRPVSVRAMLRATDRDEREHARQIWDFIAGRRG